MKEMRFMLKFDNLDDEQQLRAFGLIWVRLIISSYDRNGEAEG